MYNFMWLQLEVSELETRRIPFRLLHGWRTRYRLPKDRWNSGGAS